MQYEDKTEQIKEYNESLKMKENKVEVAAIHFAFTITMDEAKALIKKPNSLIAKELRKYVIAVLKAGAKKMLDSKKDEIVNDCKVDVSKVFKK